MTVERVDIKSERAQLVRRMIGKAIRRAVQSHGQGIAGFALVTWDMRGEPRTAMSDGNYGPVAFGLIPAYVHDAVQRHVTIDLAQRIASEPLDGA